MPKLTWWDTEISDHKAYGSRINWRGREFLVHLVGDVESILDVGCGNGLVYLAFKEAGKKIEIYKGIDLSVKFIEACRELYPERQWEWGDANNLEEHNESFNTVLLYHIFESMTSYEQAIKEALRVAKEKVIIVFWTSLENRENDVVRQLPNDGYMTTYSAKKLFNFLKELGYYYPPWFELYADGFRYNIFIILSKKERRVETAGNI